jgi:predicted ester cyclase
MGQSRSVVEKFYDLFAANNIHEATDLFDPSCVTVMPTGSLNQEQHEDMGHAFKSALPDAKMVIDHVVESDDEVVVLGHFRGTHTGDLHSPSGTIPASGKHLDLRFIDYFKVNRGVIVDHQTIFDQIEMLGQLGALPA